MIPPPLADQLFLAAGPLANGLALPLIGLWAWRHGGAAGSALAAVCWPAGLLLLTAHEPTAALLRLHQVAAACLPAALLYLALSFPIDRLRRRHAAVRLALALPSLALALLWQVVAGEPSTQAVLAALARGGALAGGAALALALLAGLRPGAEPVVRQRSLLALLGALGALAPLAALYLGGGAAPGSAAANAAALTLWMLPLAIAAGIGSAGLERADDLLRRSLSAIILTATVVATYGATHAILATLEPTDALLSSPAGMALLNLAVVLLVVPVRDVARGLVDRLLAVATYDGEACLAALARGLSAARSVDAVLAHAREVLGASLRPAWAAVYLCEANGTLRPAGRAPTGGRPLAMPTAWAEALARGELVLVDERRSADPALPAPWSALDAKLLAPLRANGEPVGVLVLGPPPRRHPYTAHDCAFLRTAAYQIALALLGSRTYDQLDELNGRLAALNAGLEQQVEERTAALHAKNEELNLSLAELQRAYKQHEQQHEGLLRAERLATLGRLTAGLAHEINTPLSAVMNALRLISDLSREYDAAIGDPEVLPDDHREIARELLGHATAATEWAGKAAAYIRGVKSHGRDTRNGTGQTFALRDALEDARALVAHRLQVAACSLELWEEPPGLTLIGDRSQLGQVLVNLISNAVDAYEERELTGGRIHLQATRSSGGGLRLRVTDWAGGIPAAVLPHVFEELYTTKSAGRGTGLGLWIAREQVEQGFGGTLDVITTNGSSCFIAEFPPTACGHIPDAPPRPTRRTLPAAPAPAAAHAM